MWWWAAVALPAGLLQATLVGLWPGGPWLNVPALVVVAAFAARQERAVWVAAAAAGLGLDVLHPPLGPGLVGYLAAAWLAVRLERSALPARGGVAVGLLAAAAVVTAEAVWYLLGGAWWSWGEALSRAAVEAAGTAAVAAVVLHRAAR